MRLIAHNAFAAERLCRRHHCLWHCQHLSPCHASLSLPAAPILPRFGATRQLSPPRAAIATGAARPPGRMLCFVTPALAVSRIAFFPLMTLAELHMASPYFSSARKDMLQFRFHA